MSHFNLSIRGFLPLSHQNMSSAIFADNPNPAYISGHCLKGVVQKVLKMGGRGEGSRALWTMS